MDCRHIETLLNMQLDGTLSSKERAELQAHLAHCPYCAVMAEEYVRLDVMLKRELPNVTPPADFTAAVMSKLPAPSNIVSIDTARSKRKARKTLHWFGGVAVAAALVCGAMLGGFFEQDQKLPGQDGEIVAEIQEFEKIFPELEPFVKPPVILENENEEPVIPEDPVSTEVEEQQPEVVAPPVEEEEPSTYSTEISLPKVAYGSENSGSYAQLTLAATEGCNAILPRISGDIVTFYVEKDGAYLEYQTNVNPQSEPTFMGQIESLPYALGIGKVAETGYSAAAADGTLALNQADGLWITPNGGEAFQAAMMGGGVLVSWAPDNNKVLFTDGAGHLYAYYVAENICLPLQQSYVSSACWSADGKTVVFAGTDASTGLSSIFKISVP